MARRCARPRSSNASITGVAEAARCPTGTEPTTETPPRRIQQRRTRGWRKPPGAIAVGRGTRWGNPFVIGEHGDRNEFVDMFEKWLFGRLPTPPDCRRHPTVLRAQLHELCDHDLMCWCPPDEPCHADLLLKLANQIL